MSYYDVLLLSFGVYLNQRTCGSAQELELEDTQSRLQQDLRKRMATEGKAASNPGDALG